MMLLLTLSSTVYFATSLHASDVGNFDIIGVKLGDDVEQTIKILERDPDAYRFEKTDMKLKQGSHTSDNITISYGSEVSIDKDKSVVRFAVDHLDQTKIITISKDNYYSNVDDRPRVDTIINSLVSEYGEPEYRINEKNESRNGMVYLLWSNPEKVFIKDHIKGFQNMQLLANISINGSLYAKEWPAFKETDNYNSKILLCEIDRDPSQVELSSHAVCTLCDETKVLSSKQEVMNSFSSGLNSEKIHSKRRTSINVMF